LSFLKRPAGKLPHNCSNSNRSFQALPLGIEIVAEVEVHLAARLYAALIPRSALSKTYAMNASSTILKFESYRRLCRGMGPGVNDRIVVEVVYGSHEAVLELLLEDTGVAQDRTWRAWRRSPRTRLSQEPCLE